MLSAFLSAPTFGQQEKGKWAGVKKNVSPVVAVDNPQLLNSAKADSPYDYLACPANSVLSGTLDETAGFTGHQSADLGASTHLGRNQPESDPFLPILFRLLPDNLRLALARIFQHVGRGRIRLALLPRPCRH